MPVNIGPKIGIDGEAEYRKQLGLIIQQAKTLDTEMKAVTASFSKNTSEQEKNAKQTEVLQKQIAKQEELVAKLAKGVAESAKTYGESAEETEKWKQQLNKAQAELNGMKSRLSDMDDGLEDVNDEMEKGEKGASSFASVLKAELLSEVIISGVKALASAMAEVGKAAVNFGKEVVSSYADFEQLQGGVQKLFDETTMGWQEYSESVGNASQETFKAWADMTKNSRFVMQNAEQAFKTAGLSMNEYMETVTGFSASLIESLSGNTEAAVDVADRAIRDMSDNANTFGTDMASIQNAYAGFAKGQFTMLDNLKLGYGGTKTEMERLIKDAAKLTDVQKELGVAVDADSLSFANIVNAISVMQEKMSIAGTTQREAAGTISGSITMLQKSWENFVTMLGNDTDGIEQYMDDVIDSFVSVVDNIAPVIETLVAQIPTVLERALERLPDLVEFGKNIITSFVEGMKQNLPRMAETAKEMIRGIADGIKKNLPDMIKSGLESLLSFSKGFRDNVSKLVDNGLEMIKTVARGIIKAIPDMIRTVPQIIINFADTINDNMPKILQTGVQLLGELIAGIVKAIPTLVKNLPKIIEAIVKTIMAFDWLNLGAKIITGIGNGIKSMASGLKQFVTNGFSGAIEYLKNLPKQALQWGKDIIANFIQGIKDKLANLTGTITGIASKIKKLLGFSEPEEGPLRDFHTYAPDMMKLFAKGITDNAHLVTDAAASAFDLQPTIASANAGASAINYGGFNFVINASDGQDANQIAEVVMERIETVLDMRGAVFA